MFERGNARILPRSGPAIAVIGIHVLLGYALVTSMGIVELPKFSAPIEAVFIPEQTEVQPEPEMKIKPDIENTLPMDEPLPDVQFEEPVVPAAMTPIPASQSAISATPASGPVAQELKTKTRVEPAYPSASRRAGEEGTVRLKVRVDERGRPQEVAVTKGSGFARLDRAAIEAVRKWRFVAATDGSKPVTAWTQVAITFRLTS
jgi:protein TonB